MTTEPIFVLCIASEPTEPNISLHASQADAEATLLVYAQPEWSRNKALLATNGREPDVPMPTTPSEGHQYLVGPANFACAWVYRIFIGKEADKIVSLTGNSNYLDEWLGISRRA